MPDYLLEIGTEELPADHVPEAQERLKSLLGDGLKRANLGFEEIITLGTPRRTTAIVKGLSTMQPTVEKEEKGPKADAPAGAAAGFAKKFDLKVEDLVKKEVGGVSYYFANVTIKGKDAAAVLQELVPQAISKLSGERLMRWGNYDLKFSRPIRWLVSLLDNQVVALEMEGVHAGRETYGNRVLNPGKVVIDHPSKYVEALRSARVLVDPEERKALIEKQAVATAEKVKGTPARLKSGLLDEVINITEWPHAILGEFEQQYLDLPDTLIETVMVHHQRYFPVERTEGGNGKGKLLPYFIAVSNNDRKEAEPVIKQGNERVLRARLADGRFFYFDDQKKKLTDRLDELGKLTFQEGLGSYLDKRDRLVHMSRILSDSLNLDARVKVCLERTMELCKLDLVSNLVRELPELQGYVGSWYAELESQPPDVVKAIASHYAPRSTDDEIPADDVGRYAALLDKLDNLVGLFALGRRPSGSSDPYALRRQAQGIVDILFDGMADTSISINALMEVILTLLQPALHGKRGFEPQKTIADLREFLTQRIRMRLQEKGFKREIIDAVLQVHDPLEDLPDTLVRCQILEDLTSNEEGLAIVRGGVRIGKILKSDSPEAVDPSVFTLDAEKNLWDAFQKEVVATWESGGQFKQPSNPAEYKQLTALLGKLVKQIDQFFVDVMVNDDDKAKRDTRHGLLNAVNRYYISIADFTKLQPLLPT
ncbi:MAG: glycine--tRNA ligase subunit beta [Candidatus Obscuribacterales bacterium]